MTCNFCGSPSAHPATGCQYGPTTLACRACVVECWTWVKQHTNGKARRRGPKTELTFYEHAGRKGP